MNRKEKFTNAVLTFINNGRWCRSPLKRFLSDNKLSWFVILVIFLCSPVLAATSHVKQVEERKPIEFKVGANGRVSFLRTIKERFDADIVIGEIRKGIFCLKAGDLTWNRKLSSLVTPRFPKIFRKELEMAHYPVPVNTSDKIFTDSAREVKKQPELYVGMLIKEVKVDLCVNPGDVKGGVYMKIFWQLFAPEIQKVVFETTTEGSYQTEDKEKTPQIFFHNAFAAACRNLLADRGFLNAVTRASLGDPVRTDSGRVTIRSAGAQNKQGKMDVAKIRTAVTTILSDMGTGSGFFINQDGYIMTNQHVVRNAKFVKVKLATGRELVGEVIRFDNNRDVALVKTEPISVEPLEIRKDDPNIGEDVYALGSPLGHTFNATLTRGILSGHRTIGERQYLQSDVTILPGSSGGPLLDSKGCVVGITVSGIVVKGFSGMNFFIPIGDALTKLGIDIE